MCIKWPNETYNGWQTHYGISHRHPSEVYPRRMMFNHVIGGTASALLRLLC